MVRSGNFGRTPRAAPSLTNTLIAIAREQQQQEDQNIMSAWQKGGSVDGRKVTDDMVLKHWRARLKDISPEDPLADTYKNVVLQYEYSIAESKMTARYAMLAEPAIADDKAMSAFYLNWSKKVPQNSEFYRVLQRDAGQYIRAAKAKVKQKVRVNEEKIYNTQMLAMEKKNELAGQSALKVLTLLAQEGAVIAESPLGAETNIVNSTNIEQVGLPGVDQIIALLGNVTPMRDTVVLTADGKRLGPSERSANTNVLYTGEDGKPVTGASIAAQFHSLDPSFTGKFDLNYIRGLLSDQRAGLQKRIDKASATGHVTDMVQLMSQQAKVNEDGRQVSAWPVAQEYNDLHAEMQRTLSNNSLLPDAKVAAIERIRTAMGKLASDPRISEDTRMQTQLRGEAEGKMGVSTLAEDLTGTRSGMTTGADSDIKVVNDHLAMYAEQKALIADGTHVMTQGEYVKDPMTGGVKFQAQTGGSQVGAATMADINNLPGAGKPVPVMVPNGDGGGATPMYVVPAPVLATANGLDGSQLGQTNTHPAASFIRYQVNGVTTTLYGVTDQTTKQTAWTNDPPWDQTKVKTSFTQNGAMQVDFTDHALGVAGNADLTLGWNEGGMHPLGNGFAIRGAQKDAKTGIITPGQLVYDPTSAVTFTDPARVNAGLGRDPYTDSFSASLVAIKSTPDGANLLTQWTGDSRFTAILDQNAHIAAGQSQTTDAQGNVQWSGGDAAAYQRNVNVATADISWAKTGGDQYDNPAHHGGWFKDGTFDTPAKDAAKRFSSFGGAGKDDLFTSLPSDVIAKGGADLQFSALGTAYKPNSMQFNPAAKEYDGLSIKTNIGLTVPAWSPPVTPAVTPMPTTGYTSGYTIPTAPTPASTVPVSTGYTQAPNGTAPKRNGYTIL